MTVDLLPIINVDGKSLAVCDTIDFSDKCEVDFRFLAPVKVDATFSVLGGVANLSAKVSCRMEYICDRCGGEFIAPLEFEFEEAVKKQSPIDTQENSDPDIIFFSGNELILDEIVYRNIFMNLPTKNLCKEDCKGLCLKCGKNLNDGDCSCDTRETDPRFDVLDKFFK